MVKNRPARAGDMGLIHGLGRSPGEGNGNLLQYSCLENFMDRGALWAAVHEVAKNQKQLSNFHFIIIVIIYNMYNNYTCNFSISLKVL